ncbi:phosphoesterase [Candidatus Bipolaricaulota bacterium]
MGKQTYIEALRQGIERLRAEDKNVVLVHHNDSDGISSAAVLETALTRDGFTVERIPLERVHPPIIERIHDNAEGRPVVYTDLGGRAAPVICAANRDRSLTLILDHHPAEESTSEKVLCLSTEFFGLSGEKEISAATGATIFALALSPENRDLAYLGVIGAVGDSHDRDGRLVGENRDAMLDAVSQGVMEISENGGRETYFLTKFGERIAMQPFAKSLTTLGAAGYAMGGPAVGMSACLHGPSSEYETKLAELTALKEEGYTREFARLETGALTKTKHIQWFSVGSGFSPMGVKIIGEFCMDIRDEGFMTDDKYIAGFQDMPTEVPGLGTFEWDLVKVSMRVPTPLGERIVAGRMPGLDWLLPEAALEIGGSIDACHGYAAAALIPRGREEALIELMDALLTQKGL